MSINTAEFLRALGAARRVSKAKVQIIGADGRIFVAAEHSGVRVEAVIGQSDGAPFDFAGDPKAIKRAVKAIGTESIEVDARSESVGFISSRVRANVDSVSRAGMTAAPIPAVPPGAFVLGGSPALARVLASALVSASIDGSRPNLLGVSILVHQGAMMAAATDAHRLVALATGIAHDGEGQLVWVHPAAVSWLSKYADEISEFRIVAAGPAGRQWLTCGAVTWTWEARVFPEGWTQVLPKEPEFIEFRPTDFVPFLRSASTVMDGLTGNGVHLHRRDNVLRAETVGARGGSIEGEWPHDGPDFDCYLNPGFLADALEAVGADAVVEMRPNLTPIVVRGAAGFAVVMPIRGPR